MEPLHFGIIAHRTGNRLRIRVPHRRGDASYFAGLEQRLKACGDVLSVSANPLTASIVVCHAPTFEITTASFGRFGLWFDPAAGGKPDPHLTMPGAKLISLVLEILCSAQPTFLAQIASRLCLELLVV